MKKRTGNLLMILGAVLVFLALSLFLYNQWEAKRAEKRSAKVMKVLKKELQTDKYIYLNGDMKTVRIDGYDYIGYITIPAIKLELPVMSKWSYEGLKTAPGRYCGSTYTNDLVIAGHNYARHFSPIKWLDIGTEVDFIDMNNRLWRYKVTSVETLNPKQVKKMIKKTDTDPWDLTLFTCNTGGENRCTVRCEVK